MLATRDVRQPVASAASNRWPTPRCGTTYRGERYSTAGSGHDGTVAGPVRCGARPVSSHDGSVPASNCPHKFVTSIGGHQYSTASQRPREHLGPRHGLALGVDRRGHLALAHPRQRDASAIQRSVTSVGPPGDTHDALPRGDVVPRARITSPTGGTSPNSSATSASGRVCVYRPHR